MERSVYYKTYNHILLYLVAPDLERGLMSLGRVQAKQDKMNDVETEEDSNNLAFKDSNGHVWADLTEIKTNGKITLALLDDTEYTFDEPEVLVGMDDPELLIKLDGEKVSNVKLPNRE